MGTVYAWDKKSSEAIPCTLLDWEQRFSGKTLDEVEFEQKKHTLQVKGHERAEKEAAINLTRMIEAIVADAESMAPSEKDRTKAERLRGIRDNRKSQKRPEADRPV